MKILAIAINNFGCGYYRLFIPLRKLESTYDNYKINVLFTKNVNEILPDEDIQIEKAAMDNDVFIIQRRYGQTWEHTVKKLKTLGKKIVYELDDCFEGIPLENLKLNAKEMTHPETKRSVISMMRMADIVTVSTPELKSWVSKYVDKVKVFVLKNTLDFSMWPEPHYGKELLDKDYVIGFAGSESHKSDLRELGSSLEKANAYFCGSVKFGFFGFMLKEYWYMNPNVLFALGVPFLKYPDKLNSLHFRIGLAPLKQCLFNECKSELRFLEHAATGIPIIATNISPFKRCITPERGILVNNKSKHWVSAFKYLINNEADRLKMGHNCYNYVKKEYNIDTYVENWHNVYKTLNT